MSGKAEKMHRKMARLMYGDTKSTAIDKETGDYATIDHVAPLKHRWNGLNNAGKKVVSTAVKAEFERQKKNEKVKNDPTPKNRPF
jgi:hypothetical protein